MKAQEIAHGLMRSRCRWAGPQDDDDGHSSLCTDVGEAIEEAARQARERAAIVAERCLDINSVKILGIGLAATIRAMPLFAEAP